MTRRNEESAVRWKGAGKHREGSMAGLLCGPGKERILSGTVQKLLCPLRRENPAAFIVFSLPNVNLKDKTVYGNLVSTDGILPVKTAVPPLIFNFSVQHSAADIKKLRGLLEIENLAAVNPANRMDQLALMEMLAVSKENAGIRTAVGTAAVYPQAGALFRPVARDLCRAGRGRLLPL